MKRRCECNLSMQSCAHYQNHCDKIATEHYMTDNFDLWLCYLCLQERKTIDNKNKS